ncbi:uncharacterized protein THITE_2147420 [Thermothielavioides terrestris NRRL 8126]|uniref:Mid2 domain-containing protein n=1 Tax=Thermothielavioides terrestris (strain ATCC 38088 / NRRL 8126) TaxID=578455 RepID=G2RCN4_THETT|nr:uncharacterized protein THITE_2147420 [Thermothielavioides terrestris NRRL 8126]AEO70630.1 hypothetical protein THITE_2147420 [Thermothielavioides terrestris NRRL 8126]
MSSSVIVRLATFTTALMSPVHVTALALVTAAPAFPTPHRFLGRDVSTILSTCGFLNGDPSRPWVAPAGYDCRVDTQHGIWGFCPTTVISATDCGLGAFCFDAGPCSDTPDQTMYSTATLIFGPDQSYDYVDCARTAGTATYFVSPRDAATAASTLSPPTSAGQLSSSSASPESTVSSPARSTAASTSLASAAASGSRNTDSSANQPAETGANGSSNNTPAIVGGVIGGLALIVFCVIAVVYILRRHSSAPQQSVQHTPGRISPGADVKSPAAGWGPTELPAGGERTPAELAAYNSNLAPTVLSVELPAGYGR